MVAAIAARLGYDLYPWQRLVHDVAGEHDPATGFIRRTCVVIVGRQNGKTSGIALPRLAAALLTPRAIAVYTAQDRNLARMKWEEHVEELMGTPFRRAVAKVVRRNGSEALVMRNGARYMIVTPSKRGGRGLTRVALAVIDEGMTHTDMAVVASVQPTMATVPYAQLLIMSNAGDDASQMLAHYRDLGRVGDGGVAYFEFAPQSDDPDPANPSTWHEAIPSLGLPHGVTLPAVAEAQRTLDARTFAQEWLNVWQTGAGAPLIDPATFDALADVTAELEPRPVVAYDVAPDRSRASVAAATRDYAGRVLVTVVDARPGTSWVVETIRNLDPDRVLADTVAGDLAASQLGEYGIPVELVGGLDVARACATFVDLIAAGSLTHHAQPALVDAIAGAVTRPFGDAWAWSRRLSSVDVTPLVAATLATWGTFDLAGLHPAVH
jgi:phage terminase large subunit-like protein